MTITPATDPVDLWSLIPEADPDGRSLGWVLQKETDQGVTPQWVPATDQESAEGSTPPIFRDDPATLDRVAQVIATNLAPRNTNRRYRVIVGSLHSANHAQAYCPTPAGGIWSR